MDEILIVEDESSQANLIKNILEEEDYRIDVVESAEEAEESIEVNGPDLILLDLRLPGKSGLSFLESIRKKGFDIPVIMMSAYGEIEDAVKAINMGAYDFIEKPLNANRVQVTVRNCLWSSKNREELKFLKGLDVKLIGESDVIKNLRNTVDTIAESDVRVFITGPTGVGKNLVARLIHKKSSRSEESFVHVNCAALPGELIESELFGHREGSFTGANRDKKGRFETASGGTLFLDEIAEIPSHIQVKLLDFMETGEIQPVGATEKRSVDTRIIAATNRKLPEALNRNKLREDLYYRLNVVRIDIPPVREWKEDIPRLFKYFLKRFSGMDAVKIKPEVEKQLKNYHWPGNVREIRNLAEKIAVFQRQKEISARTLKLFWQKEQSNSFRIQEGLNLQEAREKFERKYILKALEKTEGSVTEAADLLKVNRSSLYKKLKKLDIEY